MKMLRTGQDHHCVKSKLESPVDSGKTGNVRSKRNYDICYHGYSGITKSGNQSEVCPPLSKRRKVDRDSVNRLSSTETRQKFKEKYSRNTSTHLRSKRLSETFFHKDVYSTKSSGFSRTFLSRSRTYRKRRISSTSSDNSYPGNNIRKHSISSFSDFSSGNDDAHFSKIETRRESRSSNYPRNRSNGTRIRRPSPCSQETEIGIPYDEYERTKLWIKENFQKVVSKGEKYVSSRGESTDRRKKLEEWSKMEEKGSTSFSKRPRKRIESVVSCSRERASDGKSGGCSSDSINSDATPSGQHTECNSSISGKKYRMFNGKKSSHRTLRTNKFSSSYSEADVSTSECYSSDETCDSSCKSGTKEKICSRSLLTSTTQVKQRPQTATKSHRGILSNSASRRLIEESAGNTKEQDQGRTSVGKKTDEESKSPLKCENHLLDAELGKRLHEELIGVTKPKARPAKSLSDIHAIVDPVIDESTCNVNATQAVEKAFSLQMSLLKEEHQGEHYQKNKTNFDFKDNCFTVNYPSTIPHSEDCLKPSLPTQRSCIYGYNVTWDGSCEKGNALTFSGRNQKTDNEMLYLNDKYEKSSHQKIIGQRETSRGPDRDDIVHDGTNKATSLVGLDIAKEGPSVDVGQYSKSFVTEKLKSQGELPDKSNLIKKPQSITNKDDSVAGSLSKIPLFIPVDKTTTEENSKSAEQQYSPQIADGDRTYSPSFPTSDDVFCLSSHIESNIDSCLYSPRSPPNDNRLAPSSGNNVNNLQPFENFKHVSQSSSERLDVSVTENDSVSKMSNHITPSTSIVNSLPTNVRDKSYEAGLNLTTPSGINPENLQATGEMNTNMNDCKKENFCWPYVPDPTLRPTFNDVISSPRDNEQRVTDGHRKALYVIKETKCRSPKVKGTKIIYVTNNKSKGILCGAQYSEPSKTGARKVQRLSESDKDYNVKFLNNGGKSECSFKVDSQTLHHRGLGNVERSDSKCQQDLDFFKSSITSYGHPEKSCQKKHSEDKDLLLDVKYCIDFMLDVVSQKENVSSGVLQTNQTEKGEINSTETLLESVELASDMKAIQFISQKTGKNVSLPLGRLPGNGFSRNNAGEKEINSATKKTTDKVNLCTTSVKNSALTNDCSETSSKDVTCLLEVTKVTGVTSSSPAIINCLNECPLIERSRTAVQKSDVYRAINDNETENKKTCEHSAGDIDGIGVNASKTSVSYATCKTVERSEFEQIALKTKIDINSLERFAKTNKNSSDVFDLKYKEHNCAGNDLKENIANEEAASDKIEMTKRDCASKMKLKDLERKKQELEQSFLIQCSTFVRVVKLLASKNPSLVEGLADSFSQCLSDLGRKCVNELEEYATLTMKMDDSRCR